MNNSIRWVLSVALVCALAACGGGGGEQAHPSEGAPSSSVDTTSPVSPGPSQGAPSPSVNTTSPVSSGNPDVVVPPESVLTGVAIDGPLVGAKVCLDLNTNWVCEPNEPFTTTISGGQYRLNISPLKVQEVQNKLLIAEVGPDVWDEADGKTLRASGIDAYVLASIPLRQSVISPVSTVMLAPLLDNGLWQQGSYDEQDAIRIEALLLSKGLAAEFRNYFDAALALTPDQRALAQRTGRWLAKALGAARQRLLAEAAPVYGTDASQLGRRAAALVTQALDSLSPLASAELESKRLVDAIKASPVVAETERLKARPGRPLPVNEALAVLRAGVFDVGQLGSGPRGLMAHTLSATDEGLRSKAYRWSGGVWANDTAYSMNGVSGYQAIWWPSLNEPTHWYLNLGFPLVKADGTELIEQFSPSWSDWGPTQGMSLVERDLSGLLYRALPALNGLSGQFAAGQRGYQIRRTAYMDGFVMDAITPFFTSLAEFRDNPRTCLAGLCWRITMSAAGPDGDKPGTIAFSTPVNAGAVDLGVGALVERQVDGVAVLDVTSVPIEVQNRSALWSTKDGRYPAFAEIGGRLWQGRFVMSGAVWYSEVLLPPAVLNAVLGSAGLGEVRP